MSRSRIVVEARDVHALVFFFDFIGFLHDARWWLLRAATTPTSFDSRLADDARCCFIANRSSPHLTRAFLQYGSNNPTLKELSTTHKRAPDHPAKEP